MKTTKEELGFPRICQLPEAERTPFAKWLEHQIRPHTEGRDGYYPWDYERWKRQWKHPSTSS